MLQVLLVLERAICLHLVITQFLFDACYSIFLIEGKFVQTPQRMLNALHRANRTRRIQVCGIRTASANKKVRETLLLLESPKSGALPSAQNFEASERTARLHHLIVAPTEDCVRERVGRFLPSAFAGENPVAYLHNERFGIVRISGSDVGLDMSKMLLCFPDLSPKDPSVT